MHFMDKKSRTSLVFKKTTIKSWRKSSLQIVFYQPFVRGSVFIP